MNIKLQPERFFKVADFLQSFKAVHDETRGNQQQIF